MAEPASDPIRLVEAAYRFDSSPSSWLSRLAAEAGRSFGGSGGAIIGVYETPGRAHIRFGEIVSDGVGEALPRSLFVLPPGAVVDRLQLAALYYRHAFGSISETTGRMIPGYMQVLRSTGVEELAFLNAMELDGRGFVICLPDRARVFSAHARYVWRRVAAHLVTARRLQGALAEAATVSRHGAVAAAEAILTPTGRVEHATGQARSRRSRLALTEALRRVDAARSRAISPARAVELWQGLVDGKWSVAEHFERDGRRYYLAVRNEPALAAVHALSPRERQVIAYAARGQSDKLIAYTLGLSAHTVAKLLERARLKLAGRAPWRAVTALAPSGAPLSAARRLPA
jgi:DNA-binding CsgD family transcriptional regulator